MTSTPDAELIERLRRWKRLPAAEWAPTADQAANRLTELTAQNAELKAALEWQSIDTFAEPTTLSSGNGVLVADADGMVGEAYYRNFGDEDDGWWWANTSWGDYPEPSRPKPTHWMQLPDPPAAPSEPAQ